MLSTKTREHLYRCAARFLPRLGALGTGAAALGLSLFFISDSMRVVEITDTEGDSGTVITCATTVSDIMQQAGVEAPAAEDELRITEADGRDRIHVLRAFTVSVMADGGTADLIATDETVGELLAEANIAVGTNDILTPAADEPGEPGSGGAGCG